MVGSRLQQIDSEANTAITEQQVLEDIRHDERQPVQFKRGAQDGPFAIAKWSPHRLTPAVQGTTRVAAKVVGFKRREITEYPYSAIREAIKNAVTHRDYWRRGTQV
jgi:hypothetical protein